MILHDRVESVQALICAIPVSFSSKAVTLSSIRPCMSWLRITPLKGQTLCTYHQSNSPCEVHVNCVAITDEARGSEYGADN